MTYILQKVYRFRISLTGTEPEIWREIEVPDSYNFWELHVAIQDAMGWLDYHLHEFRPHKKGPTGGKPIGIPDDESEQEIVAGWEVPIKKYFTTLGNTITYDYDFGDDWSHEVTLIGMLLAETEQSYPRCHAGALACPPEDCGGIPGYYHLLETLSQPETDEYADMVDWLQGHAKKYWPYRADKFSARRVRFDDPYQRWCNAFNQPYSP